MTVANLPARSLHRPPAMQTLAQATALHQQGQLAEAEALYRHLLAQTDVNSAVYGGLGTLLIQTGQWDEAWGHLEQALKMNPSDVNVLYNVGNLHFKCKRYDHAASAYQATLALSPNHFSACFNHIKALQAAQKMSEALAACEAAIQRWPHEVSLWRLLVGFYETQQSWSSACIGYQELIKLEPQTAKHYLDMAHVLCQLRQFDAALSVCQQALTLTPEQASTHYRIAYVLTELERYDEALNFYKIGCQIEPATPEFNFIAGNILQHEGYFEEAHAVFEKAIAHGENQKVLANNHGNVLQALHHYDASIAKYQTALALDPSYVPAWENQAISLDKLGRHDEAHACIEQALASEPDSASARWTHAMHCLALGNFEEGWPLYEARWQHTHLGIQWRSDMNKPCLSTFDAVAGKHIYIWQEQGLGDKIQMMRYALVLVERGARVTLEVPQALLSVAQTLGRGIRVIGPNQDLGDFDFHCPYMSLPLAHGTTLSSIPCHSSYLHVPESHAQQWQERVSAHSVAGACKVGLVWSGSVAHTNDHNRSLPLQSLQPLRALEHMALWSLQKEYRAADLELMQTWGTDIYDVSAHLLDFADTAALIEQMDVVISVDTSVAHLAAAIGKPVWLLLPHHPDYRWLLNRDDSPWYPSMKLFRQTTPGDWRDVIEDITQQLQKKVSE